MSYSSDLDFMLSDAPNSVPVVLGSTSGTGILLEESQTFEGATGQMQVGGIDRHVVVNPATFPGLVKGVQFTVDGTTYEAGTVQIEKDGTLKVQLVDA
ncbi:hypothetical protein [Mesoterricola silvestris]|uniref:Uncharacterized protein n=1 Tax=Mesoterricola silvestris TaxID=2927979 RepID=A0AA48GHE2_9BACT|nr:hypothetical protein [Mesoterricola silvestris]BDU72911.1 hypothetical protein METEAL_20850 [Mesoterricola silvestris]